MWSGVRPRELLLAIVASLMLSMVVWAEDRRPWAAPRARPGAVVQARDTSAAPVAAVRATPVVSLWYRGQPAGTPRQDDLAAIRAVGFTAVAWPIRFADRVKDVQRLAAVVGLVVSLRADPRPLSVAAATAPGTQIDLDTSRLSAAVLPAVVWRAVAHGARDIAFDPGEVRGAGLGQSGEAPPAWLATTVGLARQFSANATLFAALQPGPRVTLESPLNATADVVLLETDRTWVLIATNTAAVPSEIVSRLPSGVPSALWVSLLDGEPMSMFDAPGGARWTRDASCRWRGGLRHRQASPAVRQPRAGVSRPIARGPLTRRADSGASPATSALHRSSAP